MLEGRRGGHTIRLRVCIALVDKAQVLLLPHFDTDGGPVQWNLPGGRVEFCEGLEEAALRELKEETGMTAEIERVLMPIGVYPKVWKSSKRKSD